MPRRYSKPEKYWFDHERLEVYQASVGFVAWIGDLLQTIENAGDVRNQIDRASTSIVLNISEGNGKYTAKDRCRFFDISHGSCLECAGALDILFARSKISKLQAEEGKDQLQQIVRMLFGLIKRHSTRTYAKE